MTDLLDFAEIGRRTGLALRKLRYVADYDVLEKKYYVNADRAKTSHGVPREFSVFSAFNVSLAAVLRGAGLSRGQVRAALGILFAWAAPKGVPGPHPMLDAFAMFVNARSLILEIGDNSSLRVLVDPAKPKGVSLLQPLMWTSLDRGTPMGEGHSPLCCTRVLLGELVRRLTTN